MEQRWLLSGFFTRYFIVCADPSGNGPFAAGHQTQSWCLMRDVLVPEEVTFHSSASVLFQDRPVSSPLVSEQCQDAAKGLPRKCLELQHSGLGQELVFHWSCRCFSKWGMQGGNISTALKCPTHSLGLVQQPAEGTAVSSGLCCLLIKQQWLCSPASVCAQLLGFKSSPLTPCSCSWR